MAKQATPGSQAPVGRKRRFCLVSNRPRYNQYHQAVFFTIRSKKIGLGTRLIQQLTCTQFLHVFFSAC